MLMSIINWANCFCLDMSQVCVDIFITTQTYMDIASISVIPRTTGGQVFENVCLAFHFIAS